MYTRLTLSLLRSVKKLAYVGERFTRVLRITEAPDGQKNLIGRYLPINGAYSTGLTDKFINQWTSTDFNRALRYSEEPGDIEVMMEYQEFLRKRNVNTEILLVVDHTSAFVLGESNDFDGDQVLFYFHGISDGQSIFLSLVSPDMFSYLKKDARLNLVDKYKVRDDIMIWRHDPKTAWLCRALPDQELLDKINACAEEYGVTNVIVSRIYK